MAVVKAKKIEVEIQEQAMPDAAAKWVVVLKYEPEDYFSTEILSLALTDEKPGVRHTIDTGNTVEDTGYVDGIRSIETKMKPSLTKPKKITTARGLFGMDEGSYNKKIRKLAKENPDLPYRELEKKLRNAKSN